MVYNNGYPASYQPMAVVPQPQPSYQSFQQMQSRVPATNNTHVVWIQGGLQTAKAYPIEPNTNLIMVDMAEMMAYSKFADANGMQTPIDMYSITKVVDDGSYMPQASQMMASTDNLATKDDVQMIRDEIASNLQQTHDQLATMTQMLERKNNGNNRKGENHAEQRNG